MVRGNVWKSFRFMLERSEEVQHPDAQPCCRSGPGHPQWRMYPTMWRRVCGTSSAAAWSKTRPSGQQHNRCWLTLRFNYLVSLCDVSAAQCVCVCVSYLISVCSGVSPTSSVCVWWISYLVSVCVVRQLLDQCVCGVSATWSVCVWHVIYLISVCGVSATWPVCVFSCSGVSTTSSVCVWCVRCLISVCVVSQLLNQCVCGVSAVQSVWV